MTDVPNNLWTTLQTHKGLELRVRPEQPQDAPILLDLFSHLSPASRYLRFSKALDEPSMERVRQEAERLARLGPPQDMAWLAFTDLPEQPDAPVAAVRYVRSAPGEAELAISVRDDQQQRGIGSALLLFAFQQARQQGLERLTATFRSENKAIWSLLRRSPLPVSWELDGSEVTAKVDLTGPQPG